MSENRGREDDIKEFMDILTEVKVSQAETNGKLDSLLNIHEDLAETKDISKDAQFRARRNESDLQEVRKDVDSKAAKEEVGRIVKQRENTSKNIPAWVAIAISAIVCFIEFVKFMA